MGTSRTREIPTSLRLSHPDVVPTHFTSTKNVLVAFAFKCNLACTFCMVEDSLGVKAGVSLDVFRTFATSAEATRDVRRIVLSGGEVTLDDSLLEYIAVARTIAGVRHVRLQTNATKLASPKFVAQLREAGVDEFFVSLHGATPETCDAITRVDGSFRAIMNGISTIAESGARLFTNTCITAPNFRELAALVDLVKPFRPAGMDFWGLWPRLDPSDRRELCARVGDVRSHLIAALERCEALQINPVVKWYPRCLLGDHGKYQNDAQPTVLIQNEYWDEAPEFACIYEGICAYGNDNPCAGLSEAYVHRFGWEERLLTPTLRKTDSRTDSVPASADTWVDAIGLRTGDRYGGYIVHRSTQSGDAVRLEMQSDQHAYTLFVRERSTAAPSFLTTQSLAVSYSRVERAFEPSVVESVRRVHAAIERHDLGGLRLPTYDFSSRAEPDGNESRISVPRIEGTPICAGGPNHPAGNPTREPPCDACLDAPQCSGPAGLSIELLRPRRTSHPAIDVRAFLDALDAFDPEIDRALVALLPLIGRPEEGAFEISLKLSGDDLVEPPRITCYEPAHSRARDEITRIARALTPAGYAAVREIEAFVALPPEFALALGVAPHAEGNALKLYATPPPNAGVPELERLLATLGTFSDAKALLAREVRSIGWVLYADGRRRVRIYETLPPHEVRDNLPSVAWDLDERAAPKQTARYAHYFDAHPSWNEIVSAVGMSAPMGERFARALSHARWYVSFLAFAAGSTTIYFQMGPRRREVTAT